MKRKVADNGVTERQCVKRFSFCSASVLVSSPFPSYYMQQARLRRRRVWSSEKHCKCIVGERWLPLRKGPGNDTGTTVPCKLVHPLGSSACRIQSEEEKMA